MVSDLLSEGDSCVNLPFVAPSRKLRPSAFILRLLGMEGGTLKEDEERVAIGDAVIVDCRAGKLADGLLYGIERRLAYDDLGWRAWSRPWAGARAGARATWGCCGRWRSTSGATRRWS